MYVPGRPMASRRTRVGSAVPKRHGAACLIYMQAFIVEICTLRAVDIDVRRSPVVVDGNRGHEVQLIGSTVRGQLHCLDPSSSCPPSPGAAVDTPSGWAAARGAGRLCPAAPRSSLMHCPCLRRGRRQRGSNAAYPGGVPWSGRGCHQHHGAANLRAPAYLYCDGTHAVLEAAPCRKIHLGF